MLENLTSKLGRIISDTLTKYKLSDSNIKDILKKIRRSLLEADVSWDVVKCILNNIRSKLIGIEISRKISPGKMFLKIVNNEFINILGGSSLNLKYGINKKHKLDTILMVGLQGVGKTTTVIKLAKWIKRKNNKSVLVVSCDIYRPAAFDQLKILADKAKIECFSNFDISDSINNIIKKALQFAHINKYDFLIIDSAGRLHIDELMMSEIKNIYDIVLPSEIFLIVDSMVGQNAVDSAAVFCNNLPISGFILTKMDSDSRGGVILSLSYVTKKPIRFIGIGEKLNDFELFNPSRLSSRILGMGDISGLLENINDKINNNSNDLKSSYTKKSFDLCSLDDFKVYLEKLLKIGGLKYIMDKIPNGYKFNENTLDNKNIIDMISVINSMTRKEKKFPGIINGSRKKRIMNGSGTSMLIVNKLLKQYNKLKKIFNKDNKIFSFKDKIMSLNNQV